MGNYNNPKKKTAFNLAIATPNVRLFNLLRPYFLYLIQGFVILFFTNLFIVTLPALINGGVALIKNENDNIVNLFFINKSFSSIYEVILYIVLFVVIGALLRTLSRVVIFDVGRRIERDVRARLFYHVTCLDDSFFLKTSVGDIMNHLTTDMTNIRLITGFASLNLMNLLFVFMLTLPYLFRIDTTLALTALLPFPLVMLATRTITKKMFYRTKNYQEKLGDMVSYIQENLLGSYVIRLFHQQKKECDRFLRTNKRTYKAAIDLAKVRVLMFPLMRLVIGIAIGVIIYVGGMAIITGRIELGDFVEINARILQLAWPAMSIGFVMSIYSRGKASILRVNTLLETKPRIIDGTKHINNTQKVTVKNLILNEERKKDSSGVTFRIKRGEMFGVVGASGSYKTTLLRYLCRRIPVSDGVIFYNENDINSLSLKSFYSQVAAVNEEPFLFHQSIKDNIALLKGHASDDEVKEILKVVCLDEDVAQFNDGINTIIGERGITLSGGQKQRVALARALIAKKPVLILDDALSAVDSETESKIISHIRTYLKDSLVINATHRLSALIWANTIIVLDNGQIKEVGTHEELLAAKGLYNEFWGQRRN